MGNVYVHTYVLPPGHILVIFRMVMVLVNGNGGLQIIVFGLDETG